MKILIADSQPKVRYALSVLLQGQPGLAPIGSASDADGLLERIATLQPDVLLVDWGLPGRRPADLIHDIRQVIPDLTIIVMDIAAEHQHEALSAGADSFISKIDSPTKVLETIQSCHHDRSAGATVPPVVESRRSH